VIVKNRLLTRLAIEFSHFQEMGVNLQRLTLSYTFYLMARPLLDVFMNTFLWRQANGVLLIILYYVGWVLGLPVGFLVNGLILKKFHVKNLYFFGVVFQGFGAALAIFSKQLNPGLILAYGLIFGFTASFFWANKNSLSYLLSRNKNRLYYNSIETSIRLIVGVVIPLLVGWFIVAGEQLALYSVDFAYKVMIILALGLLFVSGLIMKLANFEDIGSAQLFVTKKSKNWQMARIINFVYSLLYGVNIFYPAVLILYFGAKEGIVGTLQAVTQLLAAMSLYVLARKMKVSQFISLMTISHLAYLVSFILLGWKFSLVTAIIYIIIVTLFEVARWNSSYTLVMNAMDQELAKQADDAGYAYVFDNEIFFNFGRIIGLMSFIVAMNYFGLETAMRVLPIFFILLQFILVWPMKYLVEKQK